MSFTNIAMSEANTNKSVVTTAGSVVSKGLTQSKDKEKESNESVKSDSIDIQKSTEATNTLNGKLEAIRQQTKQKRISIEDKNVSENPIIGGGLNG